MGVGGSKPDTTDATAQSPAAAEAAAKAAAAAEAEAEAEAEAATAEEAAAAAAEAKAKAKAEAERKRLESLQEKANRYVKLINEKIETENLAQLGGLVKGLEKLLGVSPTLER